MKRTRCNRAPAGDIINELYPEGDQIKIDEIDPNKDLLSNLKRLLFQKKKAQFDKVQFAKMVSLKIDINLIPDEIEQIFEIAKDFTKKRIFVKK